MTIISEADERPAQWMTLVEAIERIRLMEGCSYAQAQVQLKIGISRGIIPAKWADQKDVLDTAVDLGYLRRSRLILSGHGLALDEHILVNGWESSYRRLLVLRSALDAWPPKSSESTTPSERTPPSKWNLARRAKVEQERMRWMTLVEGIEHIQVGMGYEWQEALRQLKNEIGEGSVRVKWADQDEPSDRPDPEYLKTSQFFPVGFGLAPDNVNETYRTLLVERAAVQKLWPLSDAKKSILLEDEIPSGFTDLIEERVTPSLAILKRKSNYPVSDHQPMLGDSSTPPSIGNRSHPSMQHKVWNILSQMRSEGESFDRPNKELAKEVAERNGKKLGDKGWGDRSVVGHISNWKKVELS